MSKRRRRNKKKKVQLKVNENVVMGTARTNTTVPLIGTANATVPLSESADSYVGKVNVITKYEAKKIDWFKVLVAIVIIADVLMLLWYASK